MPQLDVTTFSSQVLFLFLVLFFVVGSSEDISAADESDFIVDLLEDGLYTETSAFSLEISTWLFLQSTAGSPFLLSPLFDSSFRFLTFLSNARMFFSSRFVFASDLTSARPVFSMGVPTGLVPILGVIWDFFDTKQNSYGDGWTDKEGNWVRWFPEGSYWDRYYDLDENWLNSLMDFSIFLSHSLNGPFYNRQMQPRPLLEAIWWVSDWFLSSFVQWSRVVRHREELEYWKNTRHMPHWPIWDETTETYLRWNYLEYYAYDIWEEDEPYEILRTANILWEKQKLGFPLPEPEIRIVPDWWTEFGAFAKFYWLEFWYWNYFWLIFWIVFWTIFLIILPIWEEDKYNLKEEEDWDYYTGETLEQLLMLINDDLADTDENEAEREEDDGLEIRKWTDSWFGFLPLVPVFSITDQFGDYFLILSSFLCKAFDYVSVCLFLLFPDLLSTVLLLVGILLAVAFYTLAERKVMASTQRRKGPDLTGFWGVLQSVADGLKLLLKENVVPTSANFIVFIFAAFLPFVMAFSSWAIIPFNLYATVDVDVSLPILLAMSSLGVYGIIFSGWASNSKYAFLGGLRSAAQVISYELVIGFVYLMVCLFSHSLNLVTIVLSQQSIYYVVPLFPVALIFLIAMLAETNRTPFDLPEAEAELVAGYNVEYSGILFASFFLAEYANMLLMCSIFSLIFLGGWLPVSFFGLFVIPGTLAFIVKILVLAAFFIFVRAAFPRVRYDQLMILSWKIILPLEFGLLFFYSGFAYFFHL